MMNMSNIKPFIIPVLSGYVLFLVQALFWGWAVIEGPLADNHSWLVSTLLPDSTSLYYFITYSRDALINILLALPFALPFLRLNFKQKVIALVLAVVPVFLYEYSLLLFDSQPIHIMLFNSFGFYYGVFVSIGLLPFTVWFTEKVNRAFTGNEV